MSTEGPKLYQFFDPLDADVLATLLQQLTGIKEVTEGAEKLPEDIRVSLGKASDDLLRGYLLGSMNTSRAISTMMEAASVGDEAQASTIRLRADIITYVICQRLTTGVSRIIIS